MTWPIIIVIVLTLVGLGYFLDREIWYHEGARLGPHVQNFLYNRWARRYDTNKHESQQNDVDVLARPLIDQMAALHMQDALMLDVATGTGRVPLALLSQDDFDGHLIALDLSDEMLRLASGKLADHHARVEFLHHAADRLPFDDDTFDVVSCVEALIIMPSLEQPLAEIARVLKPGGIFLTTHSLEVYPSQRKKLSQPEYAAILGTAGFVDIQFESWWRKFERVLARRQGTYTASDQSPHTLADILRCPNCRHIQFNSNFVCGNCQHALRQRAHVVMALD